MEADLKDSEGRRIGGVERDVDGHLTWWFEEME